MYDSLYTVQSREIPGVGIQGGGWAKCLVPVVESRPPYTVSVFDVSSSLSCLQARVRTLLHCGQ
jgi:hypothetical protein